MKHLFQSSASLLFCFLLMSSHLTAQNVGIGTAAPSQKLDIVGNAELDGDSRSIIWPAGTNGPHGLEFVGEMNLYYRTAPNNLQFETDAGAVIMSVSRDDERVGVGVADPNTDMHLYRDGGDATFRIEADPTNSIEADNPAIELYQDGALVQARLGINGDVGADYTGATSNAVYLGTLLNNADLQLVTDATARVSVLRSGEVGIGTAAPAQRLHVVGGARFSAVAGAGNALVFADAQGDISRTALSNDANDVLDGTGNFVPATSFSYWTRNGTQLHPTTVSDRVAIGRTTASELLHVDGGVNTNVLFESDNAGMTELSLRGSGQGTGRVYVGQSATYGGGLEYNGDNTPVTTGAGADYITLFRREAGTDTWTARNRYNNNNWEFREDVYANGDVGVGTTAPDYPLDVNGDARVGFHGYSDRIPVLPTNFVADDDELREAVRFNENGLSSGGFPSGSPTNLGVRFGGGGPEGLATIFIPKGYRVVGGQIYGSDTNNEVYFWRVDMRNGNGTFLGGGANSMDDYVNFTDVNSDGNIYILIYVGAGGGDVVHGGYLDINRMP